MAPAKKSLAERIAERERNALKDIDPENDLAARSDDEGSDDEISDNAIAATEHYLTVGKSKLRQKEAVSLGPEYRGAKVSRAALEESSESEGEEEDSGDEDEDSDGMHAGEKDGEDKEEEYFDDPETADLDAIPEEDAEIDSDEALGESDIERFENFTFRGSSKPQVPQGKKSKRPVAADFMSESEDEDEDEVEHQVEGGSVKSDQDEDLGGSSEDGSQSEGSGSPVWDEDELSEDDDSELGDEEDENSESGSESEESDESAPKKAKKSSKSGNDERAKLREMFGQGQKQVVASISEAAKADAEKGIAVRHQRRAFDSILNLRIRLQKAMIAANSFGVMEDTQDVGDKPYKAAEEAAIKLLNTIGSVRETLLSETNAKAGDKRKREFDLDSSSESIWETLQKTEDVALSHRRKVLDRWSSKVRQTVTTDKTRQLKDSTPQSLVSVLEDQLLSADRLVKRARTPRSCAPAQAAKKVEEDPEIYDDADFYQLLLKELVDQRNTDASAPGNNVTSVKWAAIKEVKTRKQVDRKASKGRKLRYTVHEKLQNFMAPEDRRTWEDEAIDRFFGTLFGRKMELKEEDDSDVEMGGAKVEDDTLRLFRS